MNSLKKRLVKSALRSALCALIGGGIITLLYLYRNSETAQGNQYWFFLAGTFGVIISLASFAIILLSYMGILTLIGKVFGYKALALTLFLSSVIMYALCGLCIWDAFTSDAIHPHAIIVMFSTTGALTIACILVYKNRKLLADQRDDAPDPPSTNW